MRQLVRLLTVIGTLVVAGVASAALAVPAMAAPNSVHSSGATQPDAIQPFITQVPCNSGPPAPIEFAGQTVQKCFGGYVGTISTRFYASWMVPGGYFGNFTYVDNNGNTQRVWFRPTEFIGLNTFFPITSVTITPPF
jgi:hypothetical protein